MKTDISYLPENKRQEINQAVSAIQSVCTVEMIILFGSYARNDWVEDKYDDEHYRYQSDVDILVIIENGGDIAQSNAENKMECLINEDAEIATPVSVIVHDIEFINRQLRKAQYFFKDIITKDGVLLYDSGRHRLAEAKELLPLERKNMAQEHFDYYFEEAEDFREGVMFFFEKGKLNKAAFLLHQTAERLYTAILLVFTHYKPNTHDLEILRKLTNSLSNDLLPIFPLDKGENMRLFKLLRKAYVDARYKPTYKITQEELQLLIQKIDMLYNIGKKICLVKLESLFD